jgi:hypothetical protein
MFRVGGVGNSWAKWTLFAVAASCNTLLFTIIAIIRARKKA